MSEHTVEELEQMLADAKAKASHAPYPKWVTPDASHLVKQGETISAPLFGEVHVARDESVTVLVKDEDEEAKALAAAPSPVVEEPVHDLDPDGNPATGGKPEPSVES